MAESNNVKKYSLKEIAEHKNKKSTWIVIQDNIYDITKFMDEHPGGEVVLLEQGGKDSTEIFEDVGHSIDARTLMKDFLIGEVIDSEKKNIMKEKTVKKMTEEDPEKSERETDQYKKYVDALLRYVEESKNIITELRSIVNFVEKCHTKSNTVKTIGVVYGSAATIATVGLIFVPITGGLSACASIVAIAGAFGSVAHGVGSTWLESVHGKRAKKRIEKCQEYHAKSVEKLKKDSDDIISIIKQLVEKGINFDAALVSTFAFLAHAGKSGKEFFNTITVVGKIEKALQVGYIQSVLLPTGISIKKTLSGGLSVAFPSIEAMGKMTEAQVKAFGLLGQLGIGPEALLAKSLTIMGKVMVVASIVFTVVDVALLVKSWSSDHPLVEPISSYILQLEASIENTQNQITVLNIFRN